MDKSRIAAVGHSRPRRAGPAPRWLTAEVDVPVALGGAASRPTAQGDGWPPADVYRGCCGGCGPASPADFSSDRPFARICLVRESATAIYPAGRSIATHGDRRRARITSISRRIDTIPHRACRAARGVFASARRIFCRRLSSLMTRCRCAFVAAIGAHRIVLMTLFRDLSLYGKINTSSSQTLISLRACTKRRREEWHRPYSRAELCQGGDRAYSTTLVLLEIAAPASPGKSTSMSGPLADVFWRNGAPRRRRLTCGH